MGMPRYGLKKLVCSQQGILLCNYVYNKDNTLYIVLVVTGEVGEPITGP